MINEACSCVKSSTTALTKLFQKKGDDLEKLHHQNYNDEADRKILLIEKQMWKRKMNELEKTMAKRTRLAKVAAAACAATKQEVSE